VDEALRRSLATDYSQRLDSLVQGYLDRLVLPTGAKLYGYSFLDFSNAVFANPAAYNLTNLTQARTAVQAGALDAVGSGFLFFDDVHPSAQTHALAAADILEALGGAAEGPVAKQLGPKVFAAIEATGGTDDFSATLVAGRAYTFDVLGVSSGSGALSDPKLQILNAAGTVVATDDDGGLGLDAHLSFTPTASGLYTLRVGAVGVTKGTYVAQGPDLRGSNVRVEGGALNDTLGALAGSNVLRGGDGNDSIAGGSGFDDINGNTGRDTESGGLGDDWVVGGQDNDRLFGDGGNDLVYGNLGADICNGGDGNDIVRGGQDNDVLSGGPGADYLSGDKGDDTITGGAGADIFHTFGDAGIDRVTDFQLAQGDRVQLDAGTVYATAQVGADTVITMTGGGQMVLVGVSLASLTPGWIFGA
jgi:Ca2+-binding RTX toxin-like protein